MPLVLRQRSIGPITLLELSKRLTIEYVPELRDTLQDLAVQGHRFFLLDCSQISVIDSQGIGGLVRNWVSIKSQHGKLSYLPLRPDCAKSCRLLVCRRSSKALTI